MGKTSLEKIFIYLLLVFVGMLMLAYAFVVLCSLPYDFQLSTDGVLFDYDMKTDVDNNITAYKTVHTTLYLKGECGFWIIDLKKKEFKLLNTEISDIDLEHINQIDFQYDKDSNKKICKAIKVLKKRYGNRLQVFNNESQLMTNEQAIYYKIISEIGYNKTYIDYKKNKNIMPEESWGPYQQPLEYLFY